MPYGSISEKYNLIFRIFYRIFIILRVKFTFVIYGFQRVAYDKGSFKVVDDSQSALLIFMRKKGIAGTDTRERVKNIYEGTF